MKKKKKNSAVKMKSSFVNFWKDVLNLDIHLLERFWNTFKALETSGLSGTGFRRDRIVSYSFLNSFALI